MISVKNYVKKVRDFDNEACVVNCRLFFFGHGVLLVTSGVFRGDLKICTILLHGTSKCMYQLTTKNLS